MQHRLHRSVRKWMVLSWTSIRCKPSPRANPVWSARSRRHHHNQYRAKQPIEIWVNPLFTFCCARIPKKKPNLDAVKPAEAKAAKPGQPGASKPAAAPRKPAAIPKPPPGVRLCRYVERGGCKKRKTCKFWHP